MTGLIGVALGAAAPTVLTNRFLILIRAHYPVPLVVAAAARQQLQAVGHPPTCGCCNYCHHPPRSSPVYTTSTVRALLVFTSIQIQRSLDSIYGWDELVTWSKGGSASDQVRSSPLPVTCHKSALKNTSHVQIYVRTVDSNINMILARKTQHSTARRSPRNLLSEGIQIVLNKIHHSGRLYTRFLLFS